MIKALWVYIVTGEFGISTVYKSDVVIRELRKLGSIFKEMKFGLLIYLPCLFSMSTI